MIFLGLYAEAIMYGGCRVYNRTLMDKVNSTETANDAQRGTPDFEGEETLNPSLSGKSFTDNVYPDAILNIVRDTASVFQLKRKWERNPPLLDLTPPFQRELVWTTKQKCELIESILMGIPLPAFYMREDINGVYIVVDGKQRLSALFDFIDEKFKLDNLSILKDKNKCYFRDLSPIEQNKIEDYSLNVNVIKSPTEDRVTFDLFDRVNRSGTKLNNQEMRNALYQGTSTKLIDELAKIEPFLKATEKSLPRKHMKDRYFVLRFIAFYLWQERLSIDVETGERLEYKSNVEDFLGKTMRYLNTLPTNDYIVSQIKEVFRRVMKRAVEVILPLGGFRLPTEDGKQRRPLNMAFFESLSYLLVKTFDKSNEYIESIYRELLQDKDYISTLTYSVDSTPQIQKRYKIIRRYI